MKSNIKAIISLIVVAVLLLSGFGFYEIHGHKQEKGQVITVSSGDNLSYKTTRIVSLDPAATANLYAIGAYSYLVGDSGYGSYPQNSTLPVVGSYPSMNLEEIFNLSPQAVISFDSGYSQGQITKLLDAGINYVFLNAGAGSGITGIEQQNTLLGEITGKEKNASMLNIWMNQSLGAISNATGKINSSAELSAFYYLSSSGGIYTTGNGTFFNDFFDYAHLRNVALNLTGGFVPISPEVLANNSPQVIFLDQYVNKSALSVYPFNNSTAVQNGKVFVLPNESIFTEPNFRVIYAIAWMVQEAYGINVKLPAFPLGIQDNPDPLITG
ncbi:hypothetical protein IX51_10685 [uncultured archaeon]|nr:hypothetical protein IX51_10685 [uncultured archaeon]